MNRALTLGLVAVAVLIGAMLGELISKTPATHRLLGRILGRGELIGMVNGRGIFDGENAAEQVLRASSGSASVDAGELDRAMSALRGQFGDEGSFVTALRKDGFWRWQMREVVADVVRAERWIEAKVAPVAIVSREEAARYFEAHGSEFVRPVRIRLRHIFLAAPTGSAVIEQKRVSMQEIVSRLQRGEEFNALAHEASEDEASKMHGGDLGWVAADRLPAEFWSAIVSLPVNGPPAFVQSHLGFHAVQVLETRPLRAMSFEEAQPEIEQLLANQKRRAAVEQLRAELSQRAALAGP